MNMLSQFSRMIIAINDVLQYFNNILREKNINCKCLSYKAPFHELLRMMQNSFNSRKFIEIKYTSCAEDSCIIIIKLLLLSLLLFFLNTFKSCLFKQFFYNIKFIYVYLSVYLSIYIHIIF